MIILIPAYEPDVRLVSLVTELIRATPRLEVVVVDDGSGPRYATVFDRVAALGAEVLGHPVNCGKGAALKTGLAHVARTRPGAPVVCADSDGQHTMTDILRVAAALAQDPTGIVLGVRGFVGGGVPFRSRVGNDATRLMFRLATGRDLRDTQTGLRGYGGQTLEWVRSIPGNRFEYEMRVLLAARPAGVPIREVPIATVYLEGNRSSHFRPLVDSVRIYGPLLRFTASSLAAFALDLVLVLWLMALSGSLLLAVVGARLTSGSVNFFVNRTLVFGKHTRAGVGPTAVRYAVLALALLAANYTMLLVLTAGAGLPLLAAKLGTELTLFAVSFLVQRKHVFRPVRPPSPGEALCGYRLVPPADPPPGRGLTELLAAPASSRTGS
ncbi:MAG: bifunctional glycosyltransferase family 2/GtrA family protein [Candidatus Nanopelagicales bacterium]